ncbi:MULTISPECIES: DUF2670 domain-containing protein [unclassified Rickettsia]|uniref:DUF2670 domain-containing protein n=1 Tax=unclassified Rickettsia TaxID=114295 RepID=UPI0031329BCD
MWQALRRLIAANPMGLFLWGIISKWYLMVAITSLIILYYVAKGLDDIGFIDYVTKTVSEELEQTKAVAQNCTPKLGADWNHLVRFWDCLGDPGKYEVREGTGEKQLQQSMDKLIQNQPDGTIPEPATPVVNPYDPAKNTTTDNNN